MKDTTRHSAALDARAGADLTHAISVMRLSTAQPLVDYHPLS